MKASARILALACAAALCPAVARAQPLDKVACASALERGQILRRQSHLVESREAFVACSSAECPDFARDKCKEFLRDVERALPSLVFRARQRSGQDMTNVAVWLDGKKVAERIDGRALGTDPGSHRVRFTSEGMKPVEKSFVLLEGERLRVIQVDLEVASADVQVVDTAARPAPALAYVLGAVGVVALGSFAYFGISALSDSSDLRSTCAPACDPADVTAIKTKNVVSGISLGVGVVALAGAFYLWLTPPGDEPSRRAGARIVVSANGAGVAGSF